MNEIEKTPIPEIGLTEIDGEPRARDIEIAERLGMSRPRVIRELIERNLPEIEQFGYAPRRTAHISVQKPKGGVENREVEEYWLNEEQALLVSVLSKAPNAPSVRAMLIRCFVAWRRGHLLPPPQDEVVSALVARVTDAIVRDVRGPITGVLKRIGGTQRRAGGRGVGPKGSINSTVRQYEAQVLLGS